MIDKFNLDYYNYLIKVSLGNCIKKKKETHWLIPNIVSVNLETNK